MYKENWVDCEAVIFSSEVYVLGHLLFKVGTWTLTLRGTDFVERARKESVRERRGFEVLNSS